MQNKKTREVHVNMNAVVRLHNFIVVKNTEMQDERELKSSSACTSAM